MDPMAQLATLLPGTPPEVLQQVMAICGGAATPPDPAPVEAAAAVPAAASVAPQNAPAPMSADAPPWAKEMSAQFGELTKRFGAYEASKEADQKATEEVKMAAFSAACEAEMERHAIGRRYTPAEVADIVRPWLKQIGATAAYATGADKLTAAREYIAGLARVKPIDPRLVTTPVAAGPTHSPLSASAARILNHSDLGKQVLAKQLAAGK